MPAPPTAPLPIDPLLPELRQALPEGATVLLQAPPGAGKTTRVPLALLGAIPGIAGLKGNLVMLEPRRLATRAAAVRLAEHLGEPVGERIGYAVRHEQKRSSRTRVEVVTAGLFLRRLQADPELEGIDCVVVDEFHERGRDSDLALALARTVRPSGQVTGLDAAAAPLQLAEERRQQEPWLDVEWVQGDATASQLPSAHFDGVVMAYGLRNLADPAAGIQEIRRVLKQGGRAGVLDFNRLPDASLSAAFQRQFGESIARPRRRRRAQDLDLGRRQ